MAYKLSFSALTLIAAISACAGETNATSELRQTVQIIKKEYCETSGVPILRVRVMITVQNKSATPVILTRAALVYHYDIRETRADRSPKPPLSSQTLPKTEPFSATLLERAEPPAEFFDIIAPEASVERIAVVALWVKDLQARMQLPRATYWLRVRVQYWPWSELAASNAWRRWSKSGRLWTRSVTVGPVELPVERDVRMERCIERID